MANTVTVYDRLGMPSEVIAERATVLLARGGYSMRAPAPAPETPSEPPEAPPAPEAPAAPSAPSEPPSEDSSDEPKRTPRKPKTED